MPRPRDDAPEDDQLDTETTMTAFPGGVSRTERSATGVSIEILINTNDE